MSLPSVGANPDPSANISRRTYIYFLPYPLPSGTPIPYSIHLPSSNMLGLPTALIENTSTLVLISPSHTFVDLRYLKLLSPVETPLQNVGESTRLEWGFAGTSVIMPSADPVAQTDDEEEWKGVTHAMWTHWVDSRVTFGEETGKDKADMYPIDSTHTLEHGHGYNPYLRAVKTYEEMWVNEAISSTSASGNKICVVLRCQDDKEGARGVVVRLGQYVQGILGVGDRVTTERWEWDGE